MTASTVIGLGGLATLVAGAQFFDSAAISRELKVLLAWLATILWAIVALSSFSVASEAYQGTRPMTPLMAALSKNCAPATSVANPPSPM